MIGGLLLFVLSMVYLLSILPYGVNWWDEGVPMNAAQRLLDGDELYRDFYAQYGPGRYYLLAALFKLFGSTLQVARVLWLTLLAISAVVAYALCRRWTGDSVAWAAGAYFVLVPAQHYKSYYTLSTLLLIWVLFRAMESHRRADWFKAGLCVGLGGLFRYEMAISASVLMLAVLPFHPTAPGIRRWREKSIQAVLFFCALGTVLLPLGLYYTANHYLGDLIQYEVLQKEQHFRFFYRPLSSMGERWANLHESGAGWADVWKLFDAGADYMPTLICLGAIGWVGLGIVRKRRFPRDSLILTVALTGLMAQPFFFSRADHDHLLHVIGPMVLLMFILFGGSIRNIRVKRIGSPAWLRSGVVAVALVGFLACFAYTSIVNHPKEGGTLGKIFEHTASVSLPRGDYYDTPDHAVITRRIQEFVETVSKKESSEIAFLRFGSFWYFMLDRKSPIYQELVVSVTRPDGEDNSGEERLVARLRDPHVKYIIVEEYDPLVSGIPTLAEIYHRVDDYIQAHFRVIPGQIFGPISIVKRIDPVAPDQNGETQ